MTRAGLEAVGTLIFDGDCGFCTRSAMWLERGSGGRVQAKAWQEREDLAVLGLDVAAVTSAAYWLDEVGCLHRGADAIGRALVARRGPSRVAGRVVLSPAVRPLAARVYAWVARNRYRMPGSTATCAVRPPVVPRPDDRV